MARKPGPDADFQYSPAKHYTRGKAIINNGASIDRSSVTPRQRQTFGHDRSRSPVSSTDFEHREKTMRPRISRLFSAIIFRFIISDLRPKGDWPLIFLACHALSRIVFVQANDNQIRRSCLHDDSSNGNSVNGHF